MFLWSSWSDCFATRARNCYLWRSHSSWCLRRRCHACSSSYYWSSRNDHLYYSSKGLEEWNHFSKWNAQLLSVISFLQTFHSISFYTLPLNSFTWLYIPCQIIHRGSKGTSVREKNDILLPFISFYIFVEDGRCVLFGVSWVMWAIRYIDIYEMYVNDAFMNTYTPSSNHNEIVLISVKWLGLLSIMASCCKAFVIQIK